MAKNLCPVCLRSAGDFQHGDENSEPREVSLASIQSAAASCSLCRFVQEQLEQDDTTPKKDDSSYEIAKVRVQDDGLRFTGQWQGALVVEIYKPWTKWKLLNWIALCCSFLGFHIATQPKLPTARDVPPEISCKAAAKIINRWLKSCETHPECNSHNFFSSQARQNEGPGRYAGSSFWKAFRRVVTALTGSAWFHEKDRRYGADQNNFAPILAKRMIQLGAKAKKANLVKITTNVTVPYAALSYCWGEGATFMTDKDTQKDYEEDIPMEELPQTIKDAFCLTKELGLDYIWVDAICIVQGNGKDWEEESQKMGHIYSNAKIVLAATRSGSVKQGLFTRRSTIPLSRDIPARKGTMRARRNLNHEIIISCRTKSDYWWEKYIKATFPLLTRGWGFQERMLATRIVHFTPSELVWECQRSRRCECRVMESKLYPVMNNLGSALRMCLKQTNDERSMRQMWREIVNSYSVRKLTRIEDKLPALSGIAGLLKECSGDTYCAGLWERSLPFDLLWRCDQSRDLRVRKTRSPSWSWISVDGAVKWPVCQNPNEPQPLKYIKSTTYFECGAEGIKVLDVDCEPDGKDAYGRVKPGRLVVRTRLRPAKIGKVSGGRWNEMFSTGWKVQVNGSKPAPFWPDVSGEGLKPGHSQNNILYVMEVMKCKGTVGSWEEALVVRSIDGSKNEYERVGVAANVSSDAKPWTTAGSWFSSSHVDEITLT